MQYIVLDTNCLLQALPTKSPYHKLWSDILEGKVCLCVNTDILEEYEEILAQKCTPDIARNVVDAITNLTTTIMQNTYVHFELLPADEDDNKFVDCAIAADAEYIVTNDKHFNPLNDIPWPKVSIVSLANFVKRLEIAS